MNTKKTYHVWIAQVNQTVFEVYADNPAKAQEQAIKRWKHKMADPEVIAIEEKQR